MKTQKSEVEGVGEHIILVYADDIFVLCQDLGNLIEMLLEIKKCYECLETYTEVSGF